MIAAGPTPIGATEGSETILQIPGLSAREKKAAQQMIWTGKRSSDRTSW